MGKVDRASGLAAEFATAEELIQGIERMRALGYRDIDAYMPYPSQEIIRALDLPKSKVPVLTLIGGLIGMAIGYGIPWWTNVIDYPYNVGGRPDHAVPAFIPLTFETGILLAGAFTFFGFLALCRLPRLWHPIMEVEGFGRTTTDRYWLQVEASDREFDPDRTTEQLRSLEPIRIERFGSSS